MNASLSERSPHFSKRNQQLIDPTNPPFKRPKISSFGNSIHTPQENKNGQYLRTVLSDASGFNPDFHHNSLHASLPNGSARKHYLKESGNVNSLRDFSEKPQFQGARGVPPKIGIAKLLPVDRYRGGVGFTHSNPGETGAPFSRTPSPSGIQGYEDSEPVLPPTPERPRDRSPGSKRRDFEAIFSSGSRKTTRQIILDHSHSNPYQALSIVRIDGVPPIQRNIPIGGSLSRRTNKARDTLVERRNALQKEIKTLEDELLIEVRKNSIKRYLQSNRTNTDISKTITDFLKVNNESVSLKVATASKSEKEAFASLSVLPLKDKHWLPLAQLFCPLRFTKHGANTSPSTSRSSVLAQNARVIQGFSHESLFHFRFIVFLTKFENPEICELNIECSDWARRELGPSLQKFSDERNILKSLYAMSSFMRVARHRAKVWASLREKFSHLDALQNHPHEVNLMLDGVGSKESPLVDRRRLVTNLSRRIIKFRGIHVSDVSDPVLREISLGWHINIDNTGEAHSHVFTVVKLLSYVTDVDEATVAQQTSSLLNALISEYGIMEGISRLLEGLFKGR
ncbi:hypothetical protein TWF694_008676 [Orbilia ellipsospora]|uniref:Uncharacterized protein n=1 Tax=Orbilia ellipsospora TaxID=2528407 RepID=A0AAV9XCN0_9PEZI